MIALLSISGNYKAIDSSALQAGLATGPSRKARNFSSCRSDARVEATRRLLLGQVVPKFPFDFCRWKRDPWVAIDKDCLHVPGALDL